MRGARARPLTWRAAAFLTYALLILAAGWGYALWHIGSDRESTLESSSNQLQLTATALAAQVEAMLNDGVGAATAGANVIRADAAARFDVPRQQAILSQMVTGGSYVHALFLIAGDDLVLSAAEGRPAPTPLEQRRWLDAISRTAETTWVSPPVARDGDQKVEVAVARRVADIGGVPAWAGAVLGWETLDENYARLAVDHSNVAIVTEGGIIVARLPITPGRNLVGLDVERYAATRQYRSLPPEPIVTMTAPDTQTGQPRQYAVRRIEKLPLVAVASRNVGDALLDWSQRRRTSLAVLAAASIALLALTFALYRVLSRRYRALMRSEERFRLAVAGTNDGIWEWDGESGRLFLSPRLLQLVKRSPRDAQLLRPDSVRSLVHPEDLDRCEGALRMHLNRRAPLDVELRLRVGEEYRWFRARGQAVWDDRGRPSRMAGAIGDIDDAKRAAQAIEQARRTEIEAKQEFARELILAQEQERKRLANELHDGVGQNLSLIRNRSLMLQRMDLPVAAQRQAEALHGLASDAIEEVRSVAHNLRPLHIEEMGVTDAIEALLERLRHSSGLTIEARVENVDDVVQGSAATHLFRIVQEAVNNVLKHAEATHLWVTLERDLAHVRLTLRDDGKGFDHRTDEAGRSPRKAGLGLLSMQERSGILSGTLSITSEPGHGTRVQLSIPVIDDDGGADAEAGAELQEGNDA